MKHNKLRDRVRIILLIVLVLAMLISVIAPMAAAAAEAPITCTPLSGDNENSQDYGRWSHPVYSYLTTSNGQFMRLQGDVGGSMVAAYYDTSFNLKSRKTIPQELPLFGGFYESASNYYLVTGQRNADEDDSTEVYRITKYTKSWSRVGSCSLYGANTYIPFDAGSCRMAMDGPYLLIRTCHEMYQSDDGYHHQACVTIEVDTDSMTVKDSFYGVANNAYGYVSHSFNQFIGIDNHHIIAVDHGDAYPRAISLMIYPTDVTSGSFTSSNVQTIPVETLAGEIGANNTGASVGGFEISSSHYLVAYNSIVQDDNYKTRSTRNVYIGAVDRSSHTVNRIQLTSQAEGADSASTPQLVSVGSDRFMALWTIGSKVYYTLLNADGTKSGQTYSLTGALSDCKPLLYNNKVIWYSWNDGDETFYTIPVSTPAKLVVKHLSFDHDYQFSSVKAGHVTLKCTKCGGTEEGEAPTGVEIFWQKSDDESYYYNSEVPSGLEAGDALQYMVYYTPSVPDYPQLKVTSSDPSNCVVDAEAQTISLKKAGTYKVTFSPEYNPSVKAVYTIKVVKPLASVKLTAAKASPQAFGTGVQLTASADGGKGDLKYKFLQFEEDGTQTTLQDSTENTYVWKAETVGSYELRVDVTDPGDNDRIVRSSKLAFTIEPKQITPTISLSEDTYTYNGKARKPLVTVKDGSKTISSADYTVKYKNNKNAGTATVVVTLKRNYTGKGTASFTIKPKSIKTFTVTGVKNKAYTGSAIKQKIKVRNGSKVLTAGTDYTVKYKNNVETGKATIVIKGKGNYTGTNKQTFKIKPAKVTLSSVKNSAKKTITVKWKKAASGTGYQIQYSTKKNFSNAKTVTVKDLGTTSTKIKKLTKGKTYYVRIRAYKTISKKKVGGAWSEVKKVKIKK